MRCRDGKVPEEAVVAGKEINNPKTFIGKVSLQNEKCIGRVVPSVGSCFFLHKTMEHKRSTYDVLVSPFKLDQLLELGGQSFIIHWKRNSELEVLLTFLSFVIYFYPLFGLFVHFSGIHCVHHVEKEILIGLLFLHKIPGKYKISEQS
jgi:hypothetical protein